MLAVQNHFINNNNFIFQRNIPLNNMNIMKHKSMDKIRTNNNLMLNNPMILNNNLMMMNNPIMMNNINPMMMNNINPMMMNNINPMMMNNINPMMMNHNPMMMNNNIPSQFNNINVNMIQQKNEDKNLNKIQEIVSLQFINKCNDKYTEDQLDKIIQICLTAVRDKINDLPKFCAEKIKEKLKGQWLVLIQDINNNNFEFSFSSQIKYKDMIIFKYIDKIFYISSLIKFR